MIHQPSKEGYACHFRSLHLPWCNNSPSSFTTLSLFAWTTLWNRRCREMQCFHRTEPRVIPRRGIKRWIKSKLWSYPHQYHNSRLASTYGPVPPSQDRRPSWTHTYTHVQSDSLSYTTPPVYVASGGYLPAGNNTPESLVKLCGGLSSFRKCTTLWHLFLCITALIRIDCHLENMRRTRGLLGSECGFHKGPVAPNALVTPSSWSNTHSICSD